MPLSHFPENGKTLSLCQRKPSLQGNKLTKFLNIFLLINYDKFISFYTYEL